MSSYNDKLYAAVCSEKTLQSDKQGFFLYFADNVTTSVGKKWLDENFLKVTGDRGKLEVLYKEQPIKELVCETLQHVQPMYRKKSGDVSAAKRKDGKALLDRGETQKAIAYFSQAVIRAPAKGEAKSVDDGRSLALALWERAQVLMQINEYRLAFDDLQMSIKEGLPDKYKTDLYWKMAICYKAKGETDRAKVSFGLAEKLVMGCSDGNPRKLERLRKDMETVFKQVDKIDRRVLPKVAGEKHSKYPNATKKMTVKESTNLGRYVVARENISTGDTIVVEEPFAACLLPDCFGSHCHHCFERLVAPVACPDCSGLAFCSVECRDQAISTYHRYECKYLELLIGSGMSILSHTALRMVTQRGPKGTAELYKSKSKEKIYALCRHDKQRNSVDFLQRALMAAFLLRCLQQTDFFASRTDPDDVIPTEEELNVGELLLANLQLLQFNAHEIYETRHPANHRFRSARAAYIGVAIYPTVALFNHDCYPGVSRHFVGKNIVITAARPVSVGEPIAENYGPVFSRKKLIDRQRNLAGRYWFKCQCRACIEDWPSLENGLNNSSVRYKCKTKDCTYLFSFPKSNEVQCPRCRKKQEILDNVRRMRELEIQLQAGIIAMDNQEPKRAIDILSKAIDEFHTIAVPPHHDLHIGQEALRACLADSGNVVETPVKT